jgi:hypothetical protein
MDVISIYTERDAVLDTYELYEGAAEFQIAVDLKGSQLLGRKL